MNQEIVFASDRDFGQTDIIESSAFSFASSKAKHLKIMNQWNGRSKIKEIYR